MLCRIDSGAKHEVETISAAAEGRIPIETGAISGEVFMHEIYVY